MERALDNLRLRLRDAAYRLGLPGFLRWWTGELAPLIPAAPRSALQRRRARPCIEFGEREAVVSRPEVVDGAVRLTRVAVVPLGGDATAVAAAGRAAIASLAAATNGAAAKGPARVEVVLPAKQVLRKQLALPMAIQENLHRALAYDLDRHTPFRPDQVYFDAAVIGRDPTAKTIRVDWVAALKPLVDTARRQAEGWGASVVAVVPGPPTGIPSRLNLLPQDARPRRMLWRQWQVWAPTALVAAIALAVVVVPLLQKRGYAIALLQQTEAERIQAESAAAVRREFERLQGEYNYVLAKKYTYPGTVQIIDDVTRVLPDDTWLTQLEMKTTYKGKDAQRDMLLRGESGNSGKLISVLEDSKLVEQAAMRSPTTKLQPGPGEVFDLGAVLKVTPPPGTESLGAAATTATGSGTTAGAVPTTAPSGPATATPTAAPANVAPAPPAPASASPPAGAPAAVRAGGPLQPPAAPPSPPSGGGAATPSGSPTPQSEPQFGPLPPPAATPGGKS